MRFLFFLIFLLCMMFFSCSHETGASVESPAALLRKLSAAETYSGAAEFFSEETLSSAEKLISAGNFSEQNLFTVLNFLHGAETWDLLNVKSDDSSFSGDIIITSHVKDNMAGWNTECHMVRENGRWRIDMKKELDIMLQENGSAGKTYFRKEFSKGKSQDL